MRKIVGWLLIVTIYMLPTGLAVLKRKQNPQQMGLWNLLLGWSLVFWLILILRVKQWPTESPDSSR